MRDEKTWYRTRKQKHLSRITYQSDRSGSDEEGKIQGCTPSINQTIQRWNCLGSPRQAASDYPVSKLEIGLNARLWDQSWRFERNSVFQPGMYSDFVISQEKFASLQRLRNSTSFSRSLLFFSSTFSPSLPLSLFLSRTRQLKARIVRRACYNRPLLQLTPHELPYLVAHGLRDKMRVSRWIGTRWISCTVMDLNVVRYFWYEFWNISIFTNENFPCILMRKCSLWMG